MIVEEAICMDPDILPRDGIPHIRHTSTHLRVENTGLRKSHGRRDGYPNTSVPAGNLIWQKSTKAAGFKILI